VASTDGSSFGIQGSVATTRLASGVDAFYLSGYADVPPKLWSHLVALRERAAEAADDVPLELRAEVFGVRPFGLRSYPIRLDHTYGVVGLTDSQSLPALRFQPRADFLHAAGSAAAVSWLRETFEPALGELILNVARVDLFTDWQGWVPQAADRRRVVCRARRCDVHEDDGQLLGFSFGRRKSGMTARIYDKTEEIRGHGGEYWHEIWGHAFSAESPVWRLEFEFPRKILRKFDLDGPESVLSASGDLWKYATTSWLTMRDPTEDATRSRWPTAREWAGLQEVHLGTPLLGIERLTEVRRSADFQRLLPQLCGWLSSFGALRHAETFGDVIASLPEAIAAYELRTHRTFEDMLASKRLRAMWS
jgi:hypothetical protein